MSDRQLFRIFPAAARQWRPSYLRVCSLCAAWLMLGACSEPTETPLSVYVTALSSDADIAAMQTQLQEAGVTMGLNEISRSPTGDIVSITITFACDPTQPLTIQSDSLAGDTIYFIRSIDNVDQAPCQAGIR